jgi:MFS family permease
MLVIIGVLLTAGQLLLAFTSALPAAVPARILVGMGDAIVFSAVLALIPRWFPPRRVPLIAQGSTILGRLGQILSAVPFALLLHGAGRSVAFGTMGTQFSMMVFALLWGVPYLVSGQQLSASTGGGW